MRAALAYLALSAAGCSLALQDRPPPAESAQACSSSLWWIADAIAVAGSAVAIGYGSTRDSDAGTAIAGTSVVGGVIVLASAGNGYRWSRACSRRPTRMARR